MYVSERLSTDENSVKVFREYRDMIQKQLAETVGINSGRIHLQSGRWRAPTLHTTP